MRRYKVFFTNGNDVIIEADNASYEYHEASKKTYLVYTIGSKVVGTFVADNICGDIVIGEYNTKDIIGKGI